MHGGGAGRCCARAPQRVRAAAAQVTVMGLTMAYHITPLSVASIEDVRRTREQLGGGGAWEIQGDGSG